MQKLCNKIDLNGVLAFIFFLISCNSLLLLLVKYSFYGWVCLACHVFKDFFSKMMLVKPLLHTQLRQTNLENQPNISKRKFKRRF